MFRVNSRIDSEQRDKLTQASLSLAKQINYVSAGTIEFLYDDDSGEIWFLEMNTRLQVEHPVTEMVTGIDIVEMQLRIADDQPITISQSEVSFQGHSIEARIYAEDPANDFLPSNGRLIAMSLPFEGRKSFAGSSAYILASIECP